MPACASVCMCMCMCVCVPQLIETTKVPPVSYFEEVLRSSPAAPSPLSPLPSLTGAGPTADTGASDVKALAVAARESRRAVVRRIYDQLESMHGPCYTATLLATFISRTRDHALVHYGAKGIIRCVTTYPAKM